MKSVAVGVSSALLAFTIVAPARNAAGQVREVSLGKRTATVKEPFSDAVGMTELRDGRIVVTDRIEKAVWLIDFATGDRKRLGTNGVGPNEYGTPFGPTPWRGDTSLIFDGPGRRVLRLAPNGTLAGSMALPTLRMDGVHSYGVLRGVDGAGRVYWDAPVILRNPIKRAMKAQVIRWMPGTDTADVAQEYVDHAGFEDHFRYSPMRQTDAWVVAPDGRIGVLSASEYRLRWYRDGKLMETGPALAHTPVPVTGAEREAFWEQKATEPASGMSFNGSAPPTRSMSLERVKASYPDSIFPKVLPPFELNGARLGPNGTVWVTRTMAAAEKAGRIDVLDGHGVLIAILRLPPKARLFGLSASNVYVLSTDDDGLQTIDRYALPSGLTR